MSRASINTEIKHSLLLETGFRCGLCGYYAPDAKGLEIAHIEPYFVNKNNETYNLIPLCRLCHIKYDSLVIQPLQGKLSASDHWWYKQYAKQENISQIKQKRLEILKKDAWKMITSLKKHKLEYLKISCYEIELLHGLYRSLLSCKDAKEEIEKERPDLISKAPKGSRSLQDTKYLKELLDKRDLKLNTNERLFLHDKNLLDIKISIYQRPLLSWLLRHYFITLSTDFSHQRMNERNLAVDSGCTPSGDYNEHDICIVSLTCDGKSFYEYFKDTINLKSKNKA